MGIFDAINAAIKAAARRNEPLPPPLASRSNTAIGTGSGQLVSFLTRRLPGSHRDWAREAGDLGLNSVVAVALDWYIRNWAQGVPQVMRYVGNGQSELFSALSGERLVERDRRVVFGLAASAAVMVWFGTQFPNGVALA